MKYYYSIYFSSELGKTYHTSILDHPITQEDYLKIEEDLDYGPQARKNRRRLKI